MMCRLATNKLCIADDFDEFVNRIFPSVPVDTVTFRESREISARPVHIIDGLTRTFTRLE